MTDTPDPKSSNQGKRHQNGHLDPATRQQRLAALRRRYEAGETIGRLAADTGYTGTQMRSLLERAGAKLRQPAGPDGAR